MIAATGRESAIDCFTRELNTADIFNGSIIQIIACRIGPLQSLLREKRLDYRDPGFVNRAICTSQALNGYIIPFRKVLK